MILSYIKVRKAINIQLILVVMHKKRKTNALIFNADFVTVFFLVQSEIRVVTGSNTMNCNLKIT